MFQPFDPLPPNLHPSWILVSSLFLEEPYGHCLAQDMLLLDFLERETYKTIKFLDVVLHHLCDVGVDIEGGYNSGTDTTCLGRDTFTNIQTTYNQQFEYKRNING